MPVDERLAWGFIRIPYQTLAAPRPHILEINVREVLSDGTWLVPYLLEADVKSTIENFLAQAAAFIPNGTTWGEFIVYKNETYPTPPSFVYLGDLSDLITIDGSAAQGAGAQVTAVFKTVTNRIAKFVFLDGYNSTPQRIPYSGLGVGAQTWFDYVVDNPNIVSRDGENIAFPASLNNGYNVRLVKEYGRIVSP